MPFNFLAQIRLRRNQAVDWLRFPVTIHALSITATGKNGHFAIVNWHQRPREETVILGGPKTELRLSPDQTIEAVEAGGLTFDQLVEVPPYHYAAAFVNIYDRQVLSPS